MKRIVLATNNKGKALEIQELLADAGCAVELITQAELGIEEVPETGHTFIENALIKARHAALHSGLPALADDSGIIIDALGGAPGLYSARYAGPNATMEQNIEKILAELADKTNRQARCHCVLAYLEHAYDAKPLICQGTWEIGILPEPRGQNGFGYDPILYVPTHDCSAAELPRLEKTRISHRGIALAEFINYWESKVEKEGVG